MKRKDVGFPYQGHPDPKTKYIKFDGFSFKLVTKYSWNGPGSYDDETKTDYTKTLHIE